MKTELLFHYKLCMYVLHLSDKMKNTAKENGVKKKEKKKNFLKLEIKTWITHLICHLFTLSFFSTLFTFSSLHLSPFISLLPISNLLFTLYPHSIVFNLLCQQKQIPCSSFHSSTPFFSVIRTCLIILKTIPLLHVFPFLSICIERQIVQR